MRFKILLLILLFSLRCFSNAEAEKNFLQGNELYESGDYSGALEHYEKVLTQNLHSVDLYLNMGNAAYQMSDFPEAIFYYEKGLKIAPENEDLIYNRDLTRKELVDKVEKRETSGILSWIVGVTGGSADVWSKLAVLCVIVGFMFLTTFILLKKRGTKWVNVFFYSAFFTLFLAGSSLFLTFVHHTALKNVNDAIIFDASVNVKNKPSEKSSVAFVLHEGSKVSILSENENWIEVKFGKSKVGWLPKASLKKI